MTESQVFEVVHAALGIRPTITERQFLTHSGNTIYTVTLADGQEVVARFREDDRDTFAHTECNLAELASLGLPVPRVLAADLTRSRYPFAYLLLAKIPGRDLLYEIETMTRSQVSRLAEQIVAMQRAIATLPSGPGFGWGPIGEGGPDTCWFFTFSEVNTPSPPSPTDDIHRRLNRLQADLQPYFHALDPICFLEDLTTKNILLQNGELQGIIDFDSVCFGDPLWMTGVAAACIVSDLPNTDDPDHIGHFYVEELCRCWNTIPLQRQAIAFYAAHRAMEFREEIPESPCETVRAARLRKAIQRWLADAEGHRSISG